MIKNIPNKYTQKMLLATIDEHFKGNYDFFYLPIDFKNKCNVGYAFINMVSTPARCALSCPTTLLEGMFSIITARFTPPEHILEVHSITYGMEALCEMSQREMIRLVSVSVLAAADSSGVHPRIVRAISCEEVGEVQQ